MLLRRSATQSETVRTVQSMLNFLGFRMLSEDQDAVHRLAEDGILGPETERVIRDFQSSEGLLIDGLVGPQTLAALERAWTACNLELHSPGVDAVDGTPGRHVPVPVAGDTTDVVGRRHVRLRDDVADAFERAAAAARARGARMVLHAGMRSLMRNPTRNRSPIAMNYLGRAFDLSLYAGMLDPEADPYVVERLEEHVYRVYARCTPGDGVELPKKKTVRAITYRTRKRGVEVSDHFLDLTDLLIEHGFHPVRARPEFEPGASMMSAEWWHFQREAGLIPQATTFGSELLKLYSESTLAGTAPWAERERIFGVNWLPSEHPLVLEKKGAET